MLAPVTIREVMNPTVETITPETPMVAVAKSLYAEDIGSVVVVRDGSPVGIVTESDMVRLLAHQRDVDDLTAADRGPPTPPPPRGPPPRTPPPSPTPRVAGAPPPPRPGEPVAGRPATTRLAS